MTSVAPITGILLSILIFSIIMLALFIFVLRGDINQPRSGPTNVIGGEDDDEEEDDEE